MSQQLAQEETVASHVAYEIVVETVKRQTGDQLGWLVDERAVRTVAVANGSLGVGVYESALRAAQENLDVVDVDGRLVLGEPDAARAALVEQAERDEPDRDVVGRLNQLVDALEEGSA